MGRRHDPQLPLGGHRCELITVTSFLVGVHSSPSALSSFLARRSQDHTCRKADVNDKGRLRNKPQSKIEKNKVARLVVMPAPQANLLGGVNLLFHNGKDKAKDKGKGKADTDDTEASVACVCQACSPSAASPKPAVHRMIRSLATCESRGQESACAAGASMCPTTRQRSRQRSRHDPGRSGWRWWLRSMDSGSARQVCRFDSTARRSHRSMDKSFPRIASPCN